MGAGVSKKKKKKKNIKSNDTNEFAYNGPPIPNLTDTHIYNKNNNINRNLYKQNSLHPTRIVTKYSSLKSLTEVIIFGFVRVHCLIALDKTPQDIIDLCLLFYTVGDEWDTITSDSRLVHDEGQIIISKPNDCITISRYYAFGKDTVKRGQKRLWKFKIIERDSNYKRVSISIGIIHRKIIGQKSFDINYNNDYLYDDNRYKLMLKNGKISDGKTVCDYCSPLTIGDIIEMELDMTNNNYSTLSYWINSIPKGIAFNKIPTKGGYYTLCAAFERRDKLQIIPTFSKKIKKIV